MPATATRKLRSCPGRMPQGALGSREGAPEGTVWVVGDRVRKGYQAGLRNRPGRKPRFLFSGLLRCGMCAARLVIADRTHCACSSGVNGGEAACGSDVRTKRTVAESGLLRGIRSDLLAPEIFAVIDRDTRQSLRAATQCNRPLLLQNDCRTWKRKSEISSTQSPAVRSASHPQWRNGWPWQRLSWPL